MMLDENGIETDIQITATAFEQDTSFIISNDPDARTKQNRRPRSAAVYKSTYRKIDEKSLTARYMLNLKRELKSTKKVPTDMFKDLGQLTRPKGNAQNLSNSATVEISFDSVDTCKRNENENQQYQRPNSAKFPYYNERNIPCTRSELDNSYALDDLYNDEVFGGEKNNHYIYRHYNGAAKMFRQLGQSERQTHGQGQNSGVNQENQENPRQEETNEVDDDSNTDSCSITDISALVYTSRVKMKEKMKEWNPYAVSTTSLSKDVDTCTLISSGTVYRPDYADSAAVLSGSPICPASTSTKTSLLDQDGGFGLKIASVKDLLDMKQGCKPNSWYFEKGELDALERRLGATLQREYIHPTARLNIDRRLRRLFQGPVPAQGEIPGVDISEREEGGGGVLGVIPLGLTAGKGSVHIPTEKGSKGDLHSGNLDVNYASQCSKERLARSPEAIAAQQRVELEARYDILDTREVAAAKQAEKHRAAVDEKLWLRLSERAQTAPIRPKSATLAKVMEIYFPKSTIHATKVEEAAVAAAEEQTRREGEKKRLAVRAAVAAGGACVSALVATASPNGGSAASVSSTGSTVDCTDELIASGNIDVSVSDSASTCSDCPESPTQRVRPLTASGSLPSADSTFATKLRGLTTESMDSAENRTGVGVALFSTPAPGSPIVKKERPKTSTGVLPRHPDSKTMDLTSSSDYKLKPRDICTSASAAVRILSAGAIRRNFKPGSAGARSSSVDPMANANSASVPRPFSGNTSYSSKYPSIRNKVDSTKAVELLPYLGTLDAGASASRLLNGSVYSYSSASIVSNDVTVIKNYEVYMTRSDYQKQCDAIRKFYVHTDGPMWKFQHGWSAAFIHVMETRSPVNRELIRDQRMEDYVHMFMGDDEKVHTNVHHNRGSNGKEKTRVEEKYRLKPFVQDCDSCILNLEHRSPERVAAERSTAAVEAGNNGVNSDRGLMQDLDFDAGIIDDDGDDSDVDGDNSSYSGSYSSSNGMSRSQSQTLSQRSSGPSSYYSSRQSLHKTSALLTQSQIADQKFNNSVITMGTADSDQNYSNNKTAMIANNSNKSLTTRNTRSAPMSRTCSRARMTPSQLAEEHLRFPSSSFKDDSSTGCELEENVCPRDDEPVYGLFDSSWYGLEVVDYHVIELNLSHNNLRGYFPDCLQYLVHMEHLDLGWNDLIGHIPEHAIMAMPNLRVLSLQSNQLSGQFLPVVMGSLQLIEEVWCGSNLFEGEVPASIGNCQHLTHCCLANNKIRGEIPRSMANCKKLKYLSLSCNKIDGCLPSWLKELTKLEELHLYKNRIEGDVPVWIEEMPALKNLQIYNNNFKNTEFNGKFDTMLLG